MLGPTVGSGRRRRKRAFRWSLPAMGFFVVAASRQCRLRFPAPLVAAYTPVIATTRGSKNTVSVRRWQGSDTSRPSAARGGGERAPNDPQRKKKKFQVAENITSAHLDRLAAAFDSLARQEGFDTSTQHFASGATFEDEFEDEFLEDEFLEEEEEEDLNNEDADIKVGGPLDVNDDALLLDPRQFQRADFSAAPDETDSSWPEDMDARIAAARRDVQGGRVPVPPGARDTRASSEVILDPSVLGLRKEDDPWGIDEKHRRKENRYQEFQLVANALVCSACGADFQSANAQRPGFLPAEKFATQVQLSKLEELQRLHTKAGDAAEEWSPEDEVEWLIQTAGSSPAERRAPAADLDLAAWAEGLGLDLAALAAKKRVVCQRCHGLQNFGTVENVLRPGWTAEPLLAQEKFRDLLRPIRERPVVVIALVDLFDFSGSVLPELDAIAGENPVIVAANKADLLPAKMGSVRAENWVRRELEYMGIRSLANVGGAVRLVSCKTGAGVGGMLAKARELAEEIDGDIYVVGAANAGKSTLLNYILGPEEVVGSEEPVKLRAGNRNQRKSAITTSPLPGTTLKFIKVDIGDGRSLYDTPGLLVPGTLTQLLTPEELKIVVPKKYV
jgi:50S ribosome-binding GTPase